MKVILFANTDWYLYNYRLSLAQALRARGDAVVLLSPSGRYVDRLRAQGFRWLEVPLERRGYNPFKEVRTLLHLAGVYRREQPDIAHHFTVKCVLYGSLVCSVLGLPGAVNSITGLGYVFTEGKGSRRWLRGVVKFLYRLILKQTWTIFQNPDDRDFFVGNHLVRPERIALIRGSGVDVQRFVPRARPDGVPLVVLPTRLLWDKGVGEFVEAARQLRARGRQARFVLVGDSDDQNPAAVPVRQLQAWVQEGVVEWWGWRDDMEEIYAQASVVCLPSYREGLPKTLLEAAACARPVVATDIPGCREVVRHGENGLLIPARNVPVLVEALDYLLSNPAVGASMGARGREIVAREFSAEVIVSQTLAVYQTCSQQKKVGP